MFPTGSQFANGLDDFRHGGQGISGQLAGTTQPQTESMHEFPPLSGQDGRANPLHNASFGSYGGGMGLSAVNQSQSNQGSLGRNPLSNSANGQVITNSRSPIPQGQNGVIGGDKDVRTEITGLYALF